MQPSKTILITGGAGFIGVNAAEKFITAGWHVIIFDNLSRKGCRHNIEYLSLHYPKRFELVVGDIRYDHFSLLGAAQRSDVVLHLAAQVAVTTSIERPHEDFAINAQGSHNVLEAVREAGHKPLVIYSSTNKVYGNLSDIAIAEDEQRFRYRDLAGGVPEHRILDFHSPYGCSKGTADQYVRDYHRIYGIPTVVFRQSCIYGPRQFGVEDQGWVAWFIIAATLGKPITVYGNGKQVRDLLYIDDLIEVYLLAASDPSKVSGKIYNVGGGPQCTLSVLELLEQLENLLGKKLNFKFAPWRPGDQPIYVSDIGKIGRETGWQPAITPRAGVEKLYAWVSDNRPVLEKLFS